MRLKTRSIWVGTLLAFIPTVLVSLILTHLSAQQTAQALTEDAKSKLIAVRNTTARNIESYFTTIHHQVVTASSNLMLIEAMMDFRVAFSLFEGKLSDDQVITQKTELGDYYYNQFDQKYRHLNNNRTSNPDSLLNLSDIAIALQYDYISQNPHPLGNKEAMDRAPGIDYYHQIHKRIHPIMRNYLEAFGYYDIFLVEPKNGHIVYSVYKELDYATSLKTGPYADSGIADAFRQAMTATSNNDYFLTDFAPYLPSYHAPASFISSPIFFNDQIAGVLIFQMPVDRINAVMTHGQKWQESGLGASGETYLVGNDYTMRSDGRFLLEDKTRYAELMHEIGLSNDLITTLVNKETTIGLQPVKTQGTEAAINGEQGFQIFNDYRDIPVFSAYQPVNLGGVSWALMSEIDEQEVLAPVDILRQEQINTALIACFLALVIGGFLGWLYAHILVKPVTAMLETVDDIAAGEGDLRQRLRVKGKDEMAELAAGINQFISHIDKTFSDLLKSTVRLVPISQDLSEVNGRLSDLTIQQKDQAKRVNEYLSETIDSTERVDHQLAEIGDATHNGQQVVTRATDAVNQIRHSMAGLNNNVDASVQALDQLQTSSDQISSVIDVINNIAEQTNLLALNAAIEAARAGEQGRGFAVVADEVRTLAAKTRHSTSEVATMVTAIQQGTSDVVALMQRNKDSADQSSIQVDQGSQELNQVLQAMQLITEKVSHISVAIESQQTNIQQVSHSYQKIKANFDSSQESSAAALLVGQDIDKLGDKLMSMVQRFKVTDDSWTTSRRKVSRHPDDNTQEYKTQRVLTTKPK